MGIINNEFDAPELNVLEDIDLFVLIGNIQYDLDEIYRDATKSTVRKLGEFMVRGLYEHAQMKHYIRLMGL